jgi:outer membrane protein TolC
MKRGVILLGIIFIQTAGIFAQTLNLEQTRTLALANSRSLAKYELAIRTSILDERNQLYSMLPSLSAEYNASVYYLKDWEFVNPADTFSAGASFSVTQVIFQGGKSFIQKAIAAIATESVRIDALAEYFSVLDAADNAYYAVLEAAAVLEAEESSLQAAVLGLAIAEIRQAGGMINQGDYLKALADKEARENSHNQARRNLALNTAKLRTMTGLSQTVVPEQIDFSAYEGVLLRLAAISDEDAGALYEEFWKILAVSNPSLAKAALNSQRADKNFTLTRRDYAPALSATIFSTGFNYSTENGFNSPGSGGVSIRGTIPVDFWVLNNRVERSRIARDSAALDYAGAESSLETELQSSLLNALAQAGSVLSSRRSLEYTEKHFEYVMERYRLSQSSVSDLGDASTLLINSRNNLIRASYGFLQSISRLRFLCALDDEEKLLELLMANS